MKLEEKIALVTGASGGIGSEISNALAKGGVEVILVARRKEHLEKLKEKIIKEGGKAHFFEADLTDEESVKRLVLNVKKTCKKVDILVHSAGVGIYKKLPEISLDEWNLSIAVNATSVFLLTKEMLTLMEKEKGSLVIALGSGMGKIGVAGRSSYCASKFALRGLMLSLAKEYKNKNIKFSLLTLGSVLTGFGPLSLEKKIEKSKKGKKYIEPVWLANHIISKIENDTLEDELPIYPPNYFEESKKGIT